MVFCPWLLSTVSTSGEETPVEVNLWRYLTVVLILRGLRQEGFEFKASLGYGVSKNNKGTTRKTKERKKRKEVLVQKTSCLNFSCVK